MPVIPSLNHRQPSPAAVSTTAGKDTNQKDTNQKAKTAFEQARARVLAGSDPLARGEDKPLSAFEQARLKAKANCERNNAEVDDSKPLSAFEQARLVAAGNSASKKPIAKTYRSPPRTNSSRSPIIPRGISKALQSAPALQAQTTMETHPSKSSSHEDEEDEAVTSPPVKPPPAASMGGRFSASQAKNRSLMHSPYMPQSVMVSPVAQTPDRKAGRRTADVSTPHGPPPPARTIVATAAPVLNSQPEHVPRPPVAATAPLSPKNRPMPNWSQGADQSPVVRRPRTPPYEADEPGPVDEVDEMDLQVPEEPDKKTEEVSETEATLLEESESEVPESAQVEVVSRVTGAAAEEVVVAAESPRKQVASPRQLEISPRASIEMFQATDTTMEKIEIQNESVQNESNDPVDLSQPELETKQVKKNDRSWNLDRERSSKKNSLTI